MERGDNLRGVLCQTALLRCGDTSMVSLAVAHEHIALPDAEARRGPTEVELVVRVISSRVQTLEQRRDGT